MQKINTAEDLKAAIAQLEARQANDARLFKQELQEVYEALNPVNLIKKTIKNVFQSDEVKDNLLNTSTVLIAGIVAKALFSGVRGKNTKKALISAAMVGITNVVSNNPEAVKDFALNAYNKVSNGVKSFIGKFRKEPEQNKLEPEVIE